MGDPGRGKKIQKAQGEVLRGENQVKCKIKGGRGGEVIEKKREGIEM